MAAEEPQKTPPPATRDRGSALRARYGVDVVYAGLATLLVAFIVSVSVFDTAADAVAAMASITGVIGTIVGAYFGLSSGAAGKEEAEVARTKAEDEAKRLAAVAPAKEATAVLGIDTSDWSGEEGPQGRHGDEGSPP
jgi:F420-0:gamma-glutamyl ligase-like protein